MFDTETKFVRNLGAAGLVFAGLMTATTAVAKDVDTEVSYSYSDEETDFGGGFGFDSDRHSINLNAVYPYSDEIGLGVVLGYSDKTIEPFGGGGNTDVDVYSISFVPRYQLNENTTLFAGITFNDISVDLPFGGNAHNDALNYLAGFAYGRQVKEKLSFALVGAYAYLETDVDGIRVGGGLTPALRTITFTPRLSYEVNERTSVNASVAYTHRNRDSRVPDDRNTYFAKVGTAYELNDTWSLKASYGQNLENTALDRWTARLGFARTISLGF